MLHTAQADALVGLPLILVGMVKCAASCITWLCDKPVLGSAIAVCTWVCASCSEAKADHHPSMQHSGAIHVAYKPMSVSASKGTRFMRH